MNRFHELYRHRSIPPAGEMPADERSDLFPGVVGQSGRIVLWHADATAPPTGSFLLVGVATWSGYDMRLLDAIDSADDGPDLVGVFDTQDCESVADIQARIPGIGQAYQTPAVGLWQDGRLVASGWGHNGREIVFAACHLDVERMAELLDPRTPNPVPV